MAAEARAFWVSILAVGISPISPGITGFLMLDAKTFTGMKKLISSKDKIIFFII